MPSHREPVGDPDAERCGLCRRERDWIHGVLLCLTCDVLAVAFIDQTCRRPARDDLPTQSCRDNHPTRS